MTWILILLLIILVGTFGNIGEILEKMRESNYEFIRIVYWILVVTLFTVLIGWMFTWIF
jgi:hypothetical protein